MAENPPPMKLRCGVYGEAFVFSVTVAHNAELEDLQEAIVNKKKPVNQRFEVDPSRLTLYLAKKDGVWLQCDARVKTFLRGEVDTTYPEMWPALELDDEEYFGPNFQPQKKQIHVLVGLPPVVATLRVEPPPVVATLHVGMDEDSQASVPPYQRVAERLKDEPAVSQLLNAIQYVAENRNACPFIVLESSSGMGKTQMAFNLMARDDVEVHYLVCDSDTDDLPDQDVYSAFASRSTSFLTCVQQDLQPTFLKRWNAQYPTLGKGSRLSNVRGLELHTFQFARALLSGADTTENVVCSYEEARAVIQDLARQNKKKKQVVFIDEFPLLNIGVFPAGIWKTSGSLLIPDLEG